MREWRGETTAFCIYSIGQIEQQQSHWAEANAYYQRVFVAYQKFLPWVAKSYLGSAESLEKLGKTQDAIKTLPRDAAQRQAGRFARGRAGPAAARGTGSVLNLHAFFP